MEVGGSSIGTSRKRANMTSSMSCGERAGSSSSFQRSPFESQAKLEVSEQWINLYIPIEPRLLMIGID